MANVALGKNFILIGRHGTCKSTLARHLAQGYEGKAVVYDATKDDIISICGIPKTRALEEGRFEFATGDRTIWDKKIIVIDELGRATKENQNIFLEILQERTCFGRKLDYELVIATMNPENYAASLRLDEALLDRFYAVVPVPDGSSKKELIRSVIDMNLSGRKKGLDIDFAGVYQDIRNNYNALKHTPSIYNAVLEYTSQAMSFLKIGLQQSKKEDTARGARAERPSGTYISNRKAIQFAEQILIIGSYLKVKKEADPLVRAAECALHYTLAVPLKHSFREIVQYSQHEKLRGILKNYEVTEADLLRIEFAGIPESETERRLSFILENQQDIARLLNEDEGNLLYGYFIDHVTKSKRSGSCIKAFMEGLKAMGGYQGVRDKMEGVCWELLSARWGKVFSRKGSTKRWVSSVDDLRGILDLSRVAAGKDNEKTSRVLDLLMKDDFDDAAVLDAVREEIESLSGQ